MKNCTYYLYWYHLDTHTDPFSEGYIGITNDLSRRHKEHKYSADATNASYINTHFSKAINKYGGIDNLSKDVLHEGSFECIVALERKYRPVLSIGWNIAIGGGVASAISPLKGRTDRWTQAQKDAIGKAHKGKTISEEHRRAVSEKNKANPALGAKVSLFHKDNYVILHSFHSLSEASRQLNLPLSRLKSKHLRKRTSYGEDGWAILFDSSFDRSTTPTGRELAGLANKGKPKPTLRGDNHWKNKQFTSVSTNDTDKH